MNVFCCIKMAPNNRVTKKWEVFAGRNKFYCDGFLMTAPNSSVFYLTVVLITGTSALFFAFDCPYLAVRITPIIPAIGGILYLFTMSSLLRTSFTDPGIIPRASHDEAAFIEKQIEVPNSLNSPTYRPPPRTKEVLVRGQTVKLKYCFTCKIFRPPRASHCSLCDNCVDRFDHHCPWVGNCVGKRNYRFFYMFIVSLAFLTVFIFSCAMTHIILLTKDNEQFIEVLKRTPFSVIVVIVCFFSVWSVIGLAGFHTYLTTSDQTTNEDIKGSFSSKSGTQAINPYSHGNICLNCFHILCGPMTPSLIDRRGTVTDEYRIQMQQPEPIRYSGPVAPIHVAQPIGIQEIESQTTNPGGLYRQRSYDNLQNGNSNSASHLIENEIPLSTINNPDEIIISNHLVTIQKSVDNSNNNDDDIIENLSNSNNISGSYSNLFRDKFENDDDDDTKIIITKSESKKTIVKKRDSKSSIVENVYSNVPSQQNGTNINRYSKSDPNLHVYSNVTSSSQPNLCNNHTINDDNLLKQTQLKTTNNNNNNTNNTNIKSKSILHDDTILTTTTFISDDLDLDDPVIVTSNFGETKTLKLSNNINSNQFKIDKVKKNLIDDSSSGNINNNQNSNINNKIIDISKKNVIIKSPISTSSSSTTQTITDSVANNIQSNSIQLKLNSNNSQQTNFISPSRMRLLQDTTMIDTALDLDSLDGSSIGNNSQACLVKTAIV